MGTKVRVKIREKEDDGGEEGTTQSARKYVRKCKIY